MRFKAALLFAFFAYGAWTAAPVRAESEASRAKHAKQKKQREEDKRRADKKRAEDKKRQEEKHRADVKRIEERRRQIEKHEAPSKPAPAQPATTPPKPGSAQPAAAPSNPAGQPAAVLAKPVLGQAPAAAPAAKLAAAPLGAISVGSQPMPAAAPVKSLPGFVSGGAAAPAAPKQFANGTTIIATQIQQPPVQHATIVSNPTFVQSVATYQSTEQTPNQYYWHGSGGVNYVHYYTGSAHWYGFYVGPNFYWSRYHDGRWWWYDPTYKRWVYYHNGAWWWQDPASPGSLYVYASGAYTPYSGAAAAPAAIMGARPGAVPTTTVLAAAAAPAALVYHSDVDSPAYQAAQNANSYALVIGVESYSNLPKADFAARDAQTVRAHLEKLGYPTRNTIVLTDSQAARSSVQKYVETWLPKTVNADSRVFVYFAGHGAPDPTSGQTYLMPWDADPKYLADTGYPLKQLYAKLDALPARQVVVALDACFSGAGGRSVLAAGTRPLVTKVDVGRDAIGHLIVFSAAAGDEITGTAPDQGHGLFTYYFLKGLNGAAGTAGGPVTVQGLYDYLTPNVEDAARRDNRDQTPQLFVPASGERQRTLRDALVASPAKGG